MAVLTGRRCSYDDAEKKLMKWKQPAHLECEVNVTTAFYSFKMRQHTEEKVTHAMKIPSYWRYAYVFVVTCHCQVRLSLSAVVSADLKKTQSLIWNRLSLFSICNDFVLYECMLRNYHSFRLWASVWVFTLKCKRTSQYADISLLCNSWVWISDFSLGASIYAWNLILSFHES